MILTACGSVTRYYANNFYAPERAFMFCTANAAGYFLIMLVLLLIIVCAKYNVCL